MKIVLLSLIILLLNAPANALALQENSDEINFADINLAQKSNEKQTTFSELNSKFEAENNNEKFITFEDLKSFNGSSENNINDTNKPTDYSSLISDSMLVENEFDAKKKRLPDFFKKERKITKPDTFNLNLAKRNLGFKSKLLFKNLITFVKGKPVDDAVLLGMFSHHLSKKDYNTTQNLIGLDYKGYSLGYFKNSYSKNTFYGGASRKIYEHKFNKNYKFDVRYKCVLLHGYADWYPDLLGFTPVVMPLFAFTAHNAGVDFTAIPARSFTFTVNFRYNLPENILQKVPIPKRISLL